MNNGPNDPSTGMTGTHNRDAWRAAVAAVLIALGFAFFTGHMWEDYLITFRASLNLATGEGLVFQPGERVHSFTSPLGTLIPALFALVGGDNVEIRSLWGLRIVSAIALGGALWMAVRGFQRDGLSAIAAVVGVGALLLDAKTVDFSMNGMETGLLVFFVVFAWHAFADGARLWPCALGFAGLQWTRPDGFVFFGAIALGWILLGARTAGFSWGNRTMLLGRILTLGGLIYLPWFIFAWVYYGSPVPHTITAKSQGYSLLQTVERVIYYPWQLLSGQSNFNEVFKPTYHAFGGWPPMLNGWAWPLAVGAAVTWMWPRVAPAGRIASFAFFIGGVYISYIPLAPWYYPVWLAMAWISWAYLLHALWRLGATANGKWNPTRTAVRITALLILTIQSSFFACATWQMRTQQDLVENGVRRKVGLWLQANAKTDDTVFLECLGYIGYYSKLKMLDFPGLSSPEVVAARRAGHRSFAQVISALRPDWLVLRPWEAAFAMKEVPQLEADYVLEKSFNERSKVEDVAFLPGRSYLRYDATFFLYRRASPKA